MAEEKRTETMIAQEDSRETEKVMEFVQLLNNREKERFFDFLNGASLMKKLAAGAIRTS